MNDQGLACVLCYLSVDTYGNVKKPSKIYQTFAQYSLLYIKLGRSDATEEIWKTPPRLGSHELEI